MEEQNLSFDETLPSLVNDGHDIVKGEMIKDAEGYWYFWETVQKKTRDVQHIKAMFEELRKSLVVCATSPGEVEALERLIKKLERMVQL